MLAWLVALTRDELFVFVVLVAVVAARRAHLRALTSVALVLCFLLGTGAWLARNEVQLHRTEYVDSVLTDQTIAATINGNQSAPVYSKADGLIMQPTITPAERSGYERLVFNYAKDTLHHHLTTFIGDKVRYYIESLFPVPIFGLTYVATNVLGWAAWSMVLVLMYVLVALTAMRWWKTGRGRDVVSLMLYPAYILCFEVIFRTAISVLASRDPPDVADGGGGCVAHHI